MAEDLAAPLQAYLADHGVKAEREEFDVAGQDIGPAILAGAMRSRANLLVMGAYGHSRLREFILGGATRQILDAAALPIFMSHGLVRH